MKLIERERSLPNQPHHVGEGNLSTSRGNVPDANKKVSDPHVSEPPRATEAPQIVSLQLSVESHTRGIQVHLHLPTEDSHQPPTLPHHIHSGHKTPEHETERHQQAHSDHKYTQLSAREHETHSKPHYPSAPMSARSAVPHEHHSHPHGENLHSERHHGQLSARHHEHHDHHEHGQSSPRPEPHDHEGQLSARKVSKGKSEGQRSSRRTSQGGDTEKPQENSAEDRQEQPKLSLKLEEPKQPTENELKISPNSRGRRHSTGATQTTNTMTVSATSPEPTNQSKSTSSPTTPIINPGKVKRLPPIPSDGKEDKRHRRASSHRTHNPLRHKRKKSNDIEEGKESHADSEEPELKLAEKSKFKSSSEGGRVKPSYILHCCTEAKTVDLAQCLGSLTIIIALRHFGSRV